MAMAGGNASAFYRAVRSTYSIVTEASYKNAKVPPLGKTLLTGTKTNMKLKGIWVGSVAFPDAPAYSHAGSQA